ncbi:MAG: aminotransferase class V-fold PLP-dependent enzyme [Ignavibacteriales bacterium]|nr:aminotransferase class V-fold PLP-dependent enzyme [Ignavibacteriales bacterium]
MKRNDFFKTVLGTLAFTSIPGFKQKDTLDQNSPPVWPTASPDDELFWKVLRGQFPLTDERAYMNTGGLGASPFAVIDAVKAKMDELEKVSETGHSEELWRDVKAAAASLLGCDAGELAFTRNATEGINIVCNGLPLKRGDEIITTTHEHVGNVVPWSALVRREGVVVKLFEPSAASAQENIDRVAKLITPRTRLISIPHATTTVGLILPIKALADLAKSRNIWLFVDGAQTAGMFPFNLHELGCDAYATSGHKWLLGPKETGLLYVRSTMLDVIQPKFTGAYSADEFDLAKDTLKFHPTAQRYEFGTVSVPLRFGLGAAIKFMQRIGMENVWRRDQALSTRLFKGLQAIPFIKVLSPAHDAERSALITMQHEKLPHLELQSHLDKFNLRTRGVSEGRVNGLRISTHIYNSMEEVDRVLEATRSAWKA